MYAAVWISGEYTSKKCIFVSKIIEPISITLNLFGTTWESLALKSEDAYLQALSKSSGEMSSNPLALFTLHHTSAKDMMPPHS